MIGPAVGGAPRALAAWVGRPWHPRATQTYVAILTVTTLWASAANDRLALAALRTASTNLHGLGRQPVTVLVTSAMWAEPDGWSGYLLFVLTAALVLAPIEHRLGTARWLVAFVGGHVGATLITAAGLWAAIALGRADESLARVVDVGWSYGTLAVAAVGTWVVPRRLRWWWVAGLVASWAVPLAAGIDLTAVGHGLALAIGFALGPWLAAGRSRTGA